MYCSYSLDLFRNWRSVTTDYVCRYQPLSKALSEYQQPEKVDKIMRVQSQLDETKSVLVSRMLFRQQCLDNLVVKYNALASGCRYKLQTKSWKEDRSQMNQWIRAMTYRDKARCFISNPKRLIHVALFRNSSLWNCLMLRVTMIHTGNFLSPALAT